MQQVIPGLYISSWYVIIAQDVLNNEGITHVLTVMKDFHESETLQPFKRMIIEALDSEDEHLIDYFEPAIQWIDDALAEGGKVMIHCLAGKSRSATIMAAYLMKRFDIGVAEAISRIQDVRDVDPNIGFREQLQIFLDCNFVANSSKAAYRHWLLREDARLQKDVTGKYGKPDTVNYQTAGTVAVDETGGPVVDLRCKKCRRVLASSPSILLHEPPEKVSSYNYSYAQVTSKPRAQVDSLLPAECAHFFLEPLDWMQTTIDQSNLDGKLECPKCSSKVGAYAWQGLRCSCGRWITPCFSLQKGKVDEVRRVQVNSSNGVMKSRGADQSVKSKV